jgi:hypothetical protein
LGNLVIKTAEELGDSDVEARAGARRAARETPVLRAVLRLFADSGGPVSVAAVASLTGGRPEAVAKTLATLSHDDLLILRGDSIELAYPFSTSPTPFLVVVPMGVSGSLVARSMLSGSRRCSMRPLGSQRAAITATPRYSLRSAQRDRRGVLTTSWCG